jgi:hypothetical protein
MRRRTKKRARQEAQYLKNRKLFIEREREKDKHGGLFCIFCRKVIYGEPSLHHGLGRDDEQILDELYWFLAHNFCHVDEYHGKSCVDIPWWENYFERIRHIDKLYYLETTRMDKAGMYYRPKMEP